MSYVDEIYIKMFGHVPKMAVDLTPEERRAAMLRAFELADSLTEAERHDGFMAERPLNVSILELEDPHLPGFYADDDETQKQDAA